MTEPRASSSPADPAARLAEIQELAGRVQHELNNPLAALLAEVQLLMLEPTVPEEHGAALQRILDLVRRVAATVRRLDAVRESTTP